ncbi:MAG: hypothetical protein K8R58_14780 [Bacteroidales bacterium]|nr:hypothetical protein [Bacteroidales bacterium]
MVFEQKDISEKDSLIADFCEVPVVKMDIPSPEFDFDKKHFENIARQLSSVLKNYPDIIHSNVEIFLFKSDAYFLNSEGTEIKSPVNIVVLNINAYSMADDGQTVYDQLVYYALSPNDIPDIEKIKKDIGIMADNLIELRKAELFTESYSGPVLFEGIAAAELFAQKLFSGADGLIANREPLYVDRQMTMFQGRGNNKSIEQKINKRILSKDITIKALPKLKEYKGIKLVGSFEVDAEGVVPPDELILVENGILKTLLNGRTPSSKIKKSNGYKRYTIQQGGLSRMIGPGVISISSLKGKSIEELKKILIETAEDECLDYAFIIRKLATSGFLSPINIYRVNLKNGEEKLVRSANLGTINIRNLKKTIGVSNKKIVYNTLLSRNFGAYYSFGSFTPSGMPASFIVPDAILIEELEISGQEAPVSLELPVVENPVKRKE